MEITLEDGLNLIDQCQFDLADPFELDTEILQSVSLNDTVIKKFCEHAYSVWLDFTYKGESQVAISYQYLYDNIKQGKYNQYFNSMSHEQLDSLYEYLETTIDEETKHSLLWKHLVNKLYKNYETIDLNDNVYIKNMQQVMDNLGLIPSLIIFFIGETVTLTTCSFLYQHTTNEDKRKFLKIFLNEESKHLNGFNNLIKDLSININDTELVEVKKIYSETFGFDFDYFGISMLPQLVDNLQEELNLSDDDSRGLKRQILNNIKNNLWQQKFNQFILHKNFIYFKNLFPNSTEEEFNSIRNSKWFTYQT